VLIYFAPTSYVLHPGPLFLPASIENMTVWFQGPIWTLWRR